MIMHRLLVSEFLLSPLSFGFEIVEEDFAGRIFSFDLDLSFNPNECFSSSEVMFCEVGSL